MHAQLKTEGSYQPTAILAGDAGDALVRKVVIPAGQVLKEGAVLGIITATKKAVLSTAAATDGSQTPDQILAYDVDASAGDVEAMAYWTGTFNTPALTLGAGHTVDSVFQTLRGKGIYLA
ncbi:head decoration protein [Chromobacterium violaceum]|uniref:head decoration protein n=1 Tax=Chromobacterium violaceum TaxID=536 RepID=UPI00194F1F2E|nr:head decoration protein [Chromobacterium violaceum]QRO34133.1 head decoration protein [Chromobacterium violaceum]QRQ16064.1 head decoration protein [Chromobacterium violaceum]